MNSPIFLAYVVVFGLSAVACFVGLGRLAGIQEPDVRRGLFWLLATSGAWAGSHVGYLAYPSESGKLAFYLVGLVVGFAAVGAWLYFCFAYTGRTYHRQRTVQSIALLVFVLVIGLKLTNPIHSLYFTTEVISTPFYHLAVSHGIAHWVVMGLAYALSFVGFFVLFERFVAIGLSTVPLAVLVGFTGLPVVFDVLGLVSPTLIDMTYEPIGVAVFAVGVLFVYFDRFQAVSIADETTAPTIFLDDANRVRDYNRRARSLFPSLDGAFDRPLSAVDPRLAELIDVEESLLSRTESTETRYYRISTAPFTSGETRVGTILTLSDVTETERYRRELEDKTVKLEGFAKVVSHDLRNPLSVARGYAELARDDPENVDAHLNEVEIAHDRMERLITDLLTLAREGQSIEEPELTDLTACVHQCWHGVETADADLVVEEEITVPADRDRLEQLLENLFRNAIEHGGSDVTVTVGRLPNGFFVEDDGPGIDEEIRDDIFESGYTTNDEGTGFGLAIVGEIVEGHGWDIEVSAGRDSGARFEITTGGTDGCSIDTDRQPGGMDGRH